MELECVKNDGGTLTPGEVVKFDKSSGWKFVKVVSPPKPPVKDDEKQA